MIPPKPIPRTDKVSLWRYVQLFRKDILSAQPARLYRAWMAEFKTPFFRSFMVNDPEIIRNVLKERSDDFPKSDRIGAGLRPLLGESVFLTHGEQWKRQRRIIDPAFEGGRLRDTYGAMWSAGQAMTARLATASKAGPIDIEQMTSHGAADVIFRTLFSIPIDDEIAAEVFREFQIYQRSQPILSVAAFLPRLWWLPAIGRARSRRAARRIRKLITDLTRERLAQIETGTAPDDLATKIMTTADPHTGEQFNGEEMVDQVAIFFLAGHETSASALAWSLYLLARSPDWAAQVAREGAGVTQDFASLSQLKVTKNVFREALRLYPPVPMMVRETTCPEVLRGRAAATGAQIVLSPWHLHRHERLWEAPDEFDPCRWNSPGTARCPREAYIPFSAGPRVCPGAGFAMIEGPLLLAMICAAFEIKTDGPPPVPVAHLTVRSQKGIFLRLVPRGAVMAQDENTYR